MRSSRALDLSLALSVCWLVGCGSSAAPSAPSPSPSAPSPAVATADDAADLTAGPDSTACPNAGTFRAAVAYNSGAYPFAAASADFNRDGKMDVATANVSSGDLGVLLGNGDGTFGASTSLPSGNQPRSIQAADFNGDGLADLAAVNYSDSTVSVMLGHGDGTFASKVVYSLGSGTSGPVDMVVADFNGDGAPDLAESNYYAWDVALLINNKDGTFGPAAHFGLGSSYTQGLTTADFNGDGKADVAVANNGDCCGSSGSISVLLGNGDGTLGAPANYGGFAPYGWVPWGVAGGDMNGDGKPDLTVTTTNNHLSLFDGNGDGTFGGYIKSRAVTSGWTIAEAPLFHRKHSAVLDVIVPGAGGALNILRGSGKGTFGAPVAYTTGNNPRSVGKGDFDGDGYLDLAVASQDALYILVNDGCR